MPDDGGGGSPYMEALDSFEELAAMWTGMKLMLIGQGWSDDAAEALVIASVHRPATEQVDTAT